MHSDEPPVFACSLVGYSFAGWSPDHTLASIARLGFSGVETDVPAAFRHQPQAFAEALAAHDLAPVSYLTGGYGVASPPGPFATSSDAERRHTVDWYRDSMRLAAGLGFQAMVLFLDPARGSDKATVMAQLASAARTVARLVEEAKTHGIALRVEAYPGSLVHDVASYLRLVELVANDHLYTNLDPSNYAAVGADVVAAVHALGSAIRGVHLKDLLDTGPPLRWAPPGHGSVDWLSVATALRAIRYRGPLVVEYEAGITGGFTPDPEWGASVSLDHVQRRWAEAAHRGGNLQ